MQLVAGFFMKVTRFRSHYRAASHIWRISSETVRYGVSSDNWTGMTMSTFRPGMNFNLEKYF